MTSSQPVSRISPMPLYRYGRMAWFWRVLIVAALLLGGALLWLGARGFSFTLSVIAATLLAPALFFGLVVVTTIDDNMDGTLSVNSLLPWRRRVHRSSIGRPRLRKFYQGDVHRMYAPAMWVRIGRWLPLYIDLLGDIKDRRAFALAFHLSGSDLPGSGRSPARAE